MRLRNKGIYDLVTTFFFIMMVVFLVLAIVYVGKTVTLRTGKTNDLANKFEDISDAKGRLLSPDCYGLVIEEASANQSCPMPEGKIRGYVIEMPVYGNCTNITKVWSHMQRDDGEGQNQTYFISIRTAAGLICPGKLKVVY